MDSQITQITQNTSIEKHNEYLKLYSEFLLEIIDLNNYHDSYLNHRGHATARQVRTQCGTMMRLLHALRKANAVAYEEEKANKLIRRDNRIAIKFAKIEKRKLDQTKRELRKPKGK